MERAFRWQSWPILSPADGEASLALGPFAIGSEPVFTKSLLFLRHAAQKAAAVRKGPVLTAVLGVSEDAQRVPSTWLWNLVSCVRK